MKQFLIYLLLFVTISVKAQNCNAIPNSFSSYEQAVKAISNSTFSYTDKVKTSSSSWIRSATFKSCDGKKGFLIIGTDSHPYIHQNVPLSLWQNFKRAPSFERFYNSYLKKKFLLYIR
jgi:hypothetical protein